MTVFDNISRTPPNTVNDLQPIFLMTPSTNTVAFQFSQYLSALSGCGTISYTISFDPAYTQFTGDPTQPRWLYIDTNQALYTNQDTLEDFPVTLTVSNAWGGSLQQIVLVTVLNCDKIQPDSIPHTVNTPESFYFLGFTGNNKEVFWTEMVISGPYASDCPIVDYRLYQQKHGMSLASLNDKTNDAIFNQLFNVVPASRQVTVVNSEFYFNGFTNFEGIHVLYFRGCTSVNQPDADCREFEIRIDAKWVCDTEPTLSITPTRTDDVHYKVKSAAFYPTILPFVSNYPFSCPITDYEWKSHTPTPGQLVAWDPNLVPVSSCSGDNCQLQVYTLDNQWAVFGTKMGTLTGTIAGYTTIKWEIDLHLYVFFDCNSSLSLYNVSPSAYPSNFNFIGQNLTIRVPDSTQSMLFPVVQTVLLEDRPCLEILPAVQNYHLVQNNYSDAALNEFDANLAQNVFSPAPFHTNFTPTQNSLISDPISGCDLSTFGISDCQIDFKMQIRTLNNTVIDIATATVSFESECLHFKDNTDVFTWQSWQENEFIDGHRVGPNSRSVYLPMAAPELLSKTLYSVVQGICGPLIYEIPGLNTNLFMLDSRPLANTHPQLSVQSNDSLLASSLAVKSFTEQYSLATFRVTFEHFIYRDEWLYYESDNPGRLEFGFREPCYGIDFNSLTIHVQDQASQFGGSGTYPEYHLQNPVLQPSYTFWIPMTGYVDFDNENDKCGGVIYHFQCNDNERLFEFSMISDQDEYALRYDVTLGAYLFSLGSTNLNHVGNYTLDVIAYSTLKPIFPDETFQIQIEIQPCILESISPSTKVPNFTYNFGDLEMFQYFPRFNQQPACNYNFDYALRIESVDPTDESLSQLAVNQLPSFVKQFNAGYPYMVIETQKMLFFDKKYFVYLQGRIDVDYPQYQTFQTEWAEPSQLVIDGSWTHHITNTAPQFVQIPDIFLMEAGKRYSFALPSVIDHESDPWWVADQQFLASTGGLSQTPVTFWSNYDNQTQSFTFEPPSEAEGTTVGIYVKLQDYHILRVEKSLSQEYTIFASVLFSNGTVNEIDPNLLAATESQGEKPMAFPQKPTRFGQFTLEFDQIMLIDFDEVKTWTSAKDNPGSQVFLINIKWEEGMEVEKNDLSMRWKIVQTTPHLIVFQFTFEKPRLISRRGYLDTLQVRLMDQTQFMGANSKAYTKFTRQDIPMTELSPLFQEDVNKLLGQSFAFSLKAFMQANLLLSIPIGGLIQYLWGFINSLQLIVLTIVFTIDLPVQTYDVYLALNQLVAFDIFQVEDTIYNPYFDFPQREPLNLKFEEVGFDTPIYMIGIGSLFFVQIFMTLVNIGRFLAKKGINRLPRTLHKRIISESRLSNVAIEIIRFFMEGCIEISINLYITLFTIKKAYFTTYFWENFSTLFCLFTTLQMILLPIFLAISAYFFAKEYQLRGINYQRTKQLYAEFRPRLKPAFYYFAFILRRYLFVTTLIQFQGFPVIQVFSYLCGSLLTSIYFLDCHPYRNKFQNNYESGSEICILLIGYSILACTQASGEGAKHISGNVQLVFLGLIFLVNIYIFSKAVFAQIILSCKRLINYRKYRNSLLRKYHRKVQYLRRIQEMNQLKGKSQDDEVSFPERPLLIENPFVEKSKGFDFVFDVQTKILKYKMKQKQIARDKIKQQTAQDNMEQQVSLKQAEQENRLFDKEPEADFRDNKANLIEPKMRNHKKINLQNDQPEKFDRFEDKISPYTKENLRESRPKYDLYGNQILKDSKDFVFVNHLEDPDPLNYQSTFNSRKYTDQNLMESQQSQQDLLPFSQSKQSLVSRQHFEDLNRIGSLGESGSNMHHPYDQGQLLLKSPIKPHKQISLNSSLSNSYLVPSQQLTPEVSPAFFTRPKHVEYPRTSSEAVLLGQKQRQIMQFNAKPYNVEIQQKIKERNDRTKVEMFKLYQKTGVKPTHINFNQAGSNRPALDSLHRFYGNGWQNQL